MTCRQCGTVIAEKALICYKCGTSTTEARYAPVPIRDASRARSTIAVVVVVVALVAGIYLGEAGSTPRVRVIGWAVAAAAVVAFGGRLVLSRRT